MTLPFRRILALGAHCDDVEFGAGGTVARLIDEGAAVSIVAFSACERSVPTQWPREVLRVEAASAVAALGAGVTTVLDLDVRTFPDQRQRVLEEILRLRAEFRPDLILAPSSFDRHQDHAVVAAEAMRASRGVSLWGYELPWNCPTFTANAHVRLDAAHVDRKLAALACYASQAAKSYATEEVVRAQLVAVGAQVGAPLAERFEVIRWVS